MNEEAPNSERILILTPTGNDAANAVFVLSQAGLTGIICQHCQDLAHKFSQGAGALLVAEEALNRENVTCLVEILSHQPQWSDIPLLLITSTTATVQAGQSLLNFFSPHGNVALIERPLRPISLVSALQAAVRARRRQYQVREFIADQQRNLARTQEDERRFRAVFNQQFQFMALLSPEGVVMEISDLPLLTAGISREQAIGKLFWETPFWEGLDEMKKSWPERLDQAARINEPVLSVDTFRTADGSARIADAAVTAVRNAEGGIQFFIIQASDITKRKEAEAQKERETRRVQLLADAAGRLLASEAPEQIARDIFERLAPELSLDVYLNYMVAEDGKTLLLDSYSGVEEEKIAPMQTLQFGAPVCGVVARERRPWTVSHVQTCEQPPLPFHRSIGLKTYTCNPLIVGNRLIGTLGFGSRTRDQLSEDEIDYLRTICHFVALAQERAIDRHELEKRVAERTAKLQETVGELEAFSYSVSHDLRAPLRAMQGYSQFLLEDYADKLDSTGQDYVRRIVTAAERLDRLVSDILTYSRVARMSFQASSIDLQKLIHEIIQGYPALQPDKAHIEIKAPLLPVAGHEGSLTQCISNLLANAVKFVRDDVRPQVVVWTQRHNGNVRLYFKDNGIGISREHQERIFQMFEKAPQPKGYEGTGIGLAIVRKAVERMGGTAGVESEPGKGSTFWIELPPAL